METQDDKPEIIPADKRLRTGNRARTVANLAQLAALVCVVAGICGMWYLYRLAVTLLRQ